MVHWNSILTTFADGCFTDIWSPPPLLMTGSLQCDLDHLGRWLAHWNLITGILVDCWFTLNLLIGIYWNLIVCWWLANLSLISTVMVDGCCTDTWSQQPWLMAGSHLTWSRAHLLIGIYWNLISTALVYGWFSETWSGLSWLISGSPKFDLNNFYWWLVNWYLTSTTIVDNWFTVI